MKILYVVRNLDRYSGAARQAINLALIFKKNGIRIDILNVSDLNEDNIFLHPELFITTVTRNESNISLFNILIDYCIVHFHGVFMKLFIFSKLAGNKNILKSTLDGEDDFLTLTSGKQRYIKKLILKYSIDLNNGLTSQIANKNKRIISQKKIIKINNFVNVAKTIEVKKENLFIYSGAIIKRKNPHLSILYFLRNYAQLENSKLYLIGPSNIEEESGDIDYALKLKEKYSKYKDSIIFIDNLPHDELQEYFIKSKALLFFSDREGMPNVVLESLANNCFPILFTMNGLSKEILTNINAGAIINDINESIDINHIDNSIKFKSPHSLALDKYSFNIGFEKYKTLYKSMRNYNG